MLFYLLFRIIKYVDVAAIHDGVLSLRGYAPQCHRRLSLPRVCIL